jgi:hypothetical protein
LCCLRIRVAQKTNSHLNERQTRWASDDPLGGKQSPDFDPAIQIPPATRRSAWRPLKEDVFTATLATFVASDMNKAGIDSGEPFVMLAADDIEGTRME